jgi:hypothetical protein
MVEGPRVNQSLRGGLRSATVVERPSGGVVDKKQANLTRKVVREAVEAYELAQLEGSEKMKTP